MISVISPTHNSAAFVLDLLNSLKKQSFQDFELIIVDDRSEDNTKEVVEAFDAGFEVKVFDSQGVGPGSARNLGLRLSSSDYVTFVDSDDVVHEDYLFLMHRVATENGSDIVESLYRITGSDGVVLSKSNVKAHIARCGRLKGLLDGSFSRIACGKLYRRAMLVDGDVFYGEHIHNGEDHVFSLQAYMAAKKIDTVFRYLYDWRRRDNSLTKKPVDEKTVSDFVEVNSIKFDILNRVDGGGLLDAWAVRMFKELRVLTRDLVAGSPSRARAEDLFSRMETCIKSAYFYKSAMAVVKMVNPELVSDFELKKTFNFELAGK